MKKTLFTLTLAFALTGCSRDWMYDETLVVTQKPMVATITETERYPTLDLDTNTLDHIALEYKAMNDPSLRITAVYDPKIDPHFCDHDKIARVKRRLGYRGVYNVEIERMAVPGTKPQILMRYDDIELQVAAECRGQEMPSSGFGTNNERDYKMGCALQNQILSQLANPRDAYGRGGLSGGSNGERAANVIQHVATTGEAQEFVPGYQISESIQTTE